MGLLNVDLSKISLTGNSYYSNYSNTPAYSYYSGSLFGYSYFPQTYSIPGLFFSSYKLNDKTYDYKSSSKLTALSNAGYDASKGNRLAEIAKNNSVGFIGQCATYAKKAIEKAGLGKYQYGDAYQCDDILRKNSNFKEISTKGLNLKDLPAGCVLVYERGVSGYSSQYGHIEITDGKGHAYSDGKTNNIKDGAKVFVPVSNYA